MFQVDINEFADLSDEEFNMFSSGGLSINESEDESDFYDFENQKVVDYQFEQYKNHEDEDGQYQNPDGDDQGIEIDSFLFE